MLKTAVIFGADAVYIGGEAFGLRAKAKNFSMEDMAEGIRFAHEHGVKVYVTANILAHNSDLAGVREYFKELREIEPDALIIADPAVFEIAKEVCPEIERHISTQANKDVYKRQFEDCCTIFVAKHPVTKPNINIIKKSEENLAEKIDGLVRQAIETVEIIEVK